MNNSNEQSKEASLEELRELEELMNSAYVTATKRPDWAQLKPDVKRIFFMYAFLSEDERFNTWKSLMGWDKFKETGKDFIKKKLETESTLNKDIRVRDTEYAIASTPYVAIADELGVMHNQTERLFEWYKKPSTSAAPCTPIVQSSGTGKTKLLFEFRAQIRDQKIPEYQIILISCLPKDDRREKQGTRIYDHYLDFKEKDNEYLKNELSKRINELSNELSKEGKQFEKIILIFDEAQELARNSGTHLKALRKFLRKKRHYKTVAFFAGTNLNLANCYPPEEERRSSREGEATNDFYKAGKTPNPPLFELNTMGCLAKKINIDEGETEFVKSIPYGRPLFATLLFDEDERHQWPVKMTHRIEDREMKIIATRLLLNTSDPFVNSTLLPFASVWATRVQLGGVSTAVIQELVAKGYAHLTSFRAVNMTTNSENSPRPTVTFANLPDPVVARLAMCMMNEKWKLKVGDTVIKGRKKIKWTAKLKELFSSGLCRPSRGDLGELVSAAYLLFCGDELRYRNDKRFQTFSVPVSEWFSLVNDPKLPLLGKEKQESNQPCINFIQFCRNNLRFGMKDVCNESFLEYIWNCCCAVYAYEGAENIDAYASIKYTDSRGNTQYTPLIISIKTRDNYSRSKATRNVESITKDLFDIEQKCALILVILLDRGDASKGTSNTGSCDNEGDTEMADAVENTTPKRKTRSGNTYQKVADASKNLPIENCTSKIVSRIVTIPSDDPFNLTDVVRGATRLKEESNVFDSHCFTGIVPANELCGNREKDEEGVKRVLLSDANPEVELKLSRLWNDRHDSLQDRDNSEMTVEATD